MILITALATVCSLCFKYLLFGEHLCLQKRRRLSDQQATMASSSAPGSAGSGKRQGRATLAELGRGKSVEGQSPGKLAELRREDDDDQNSDVTEEDIQAVLDEAKMNELLIKEGRYLCDVCLKEGNHFDYECPYFVSIPKGAKIGSGYDIVCANCGEDHQNDSDDDAGVLGEDWQGRAVLKVCNFCGGKSGHWYDECPMRRKTT